MQNSEINFKLLLEMIKCVKREVNYRQWVYPKRTAAGKMKQEQAEKEIKLMSAVLAALQKIYDGTAPQAVQQTFLNAQEFIKQDCGNYLN